MFDDKKIIERIKNSSSSEKNQIFEDIYNQYYKLICFVIAKIVVNDDDIEELANDTFLKLFENITSVKTSIKYYLVRSAKNISINFEKKNKKKIIVEDKTIDSVMDYQDYSNKNYQEVIEFLETFLNEEEIVIIINHIVYDKTFKWISKKKKKTENTIKTIYYRAMEKVKAKGGMKNE